MAYSPSQFMDDMQDVLRDQEEEMHPVSLRSAAPAPPQGFSLLKSSARMPSSVSVDNLYHQRQPSSQEYNPASPALDLRSNQMFSPFQNPAHSAHSASWSAMPSVESLSLNKKRPGVNSLRTSTMSPDSCSSTPMLPDLSKSRSPLLNSVENDPAYRVDVHSMSDEQHLTYIKRRGHVVFHDMHDPHLSKYKMQHLCGLDRVAACLDQNVIAPLHNPDRYALPGLYESLLWFNGKTGCGILSAIRAKLGGVCNILIYRPVDDGKKPDDLFFVDLLLFAVRKSPCVVVVHRADAAFAALQAKKHDSKLPEGVIETDKVLKAFAGAWKRMIDTSVHNRVWSIHVQQFNPSLYDLYYRTCFFHGSRAIAEVDDMRGNVDYTMRVFKLLLEQYLDVSQNEAIDKDSYINRISVVIQTRLIQCKEQDHQLSFVKRPRDLCDIIAEAFHAHRSAASIFQLDGSPLPNVNLFEAALENKKEAALRNVAMRVIQMQA